ncbi:putative NADH-flavin reductase [Kitasatospora sp. MAA19]|uniref:NAD(P)-dependent oxidoreductase n=1 Tax=unclassified Kitasatospora TaxID=2633591 RepID=UPI0024754883|nr:NAD(P)H-binding protein [Kitasatospora sp. MAA19]MDH6706349.1 putative NADH-flavin reductase [Kitasatospora sp. MAA19]
MSRIVIFGAGGRVGRAAVAEAVRRGHSVTAVVRDPGKYAELGTSDAVTVVRGDATDAESVAVVAAGHDAAVNASARLDLPAEEYFTAAARALVDGLGRTGVKRLLVLGIATTLETSPGVRVMDDPQFPDEYRLFSQGHVAEFELLRTAATELDWLMVVPPLDLNAQAEATGHYTSAVGAVVGQGRISHQDLAVALLDEIETPKHRGVQWAVSH